MQRIPIGSVHRVTGPASGEVVLFERDADVKIFSPRNPGWQAQSVLRDNQHEAFGDTHLGRNLYLGSGKGQVADDAINRLAAEEFNPRGFRDGVTRYDPSFGHVSTIRIEVSFHYTETISVSLTANEPAAGFR